MEIKMLSAFLVLCSASYLSAECPSSLPAGTVERPGTTDCYYGMLGANDEKTYDDAQAGCQSLDMSLASIRSEEEYDWFKSQYETSNIWEFIWLSGREDTGPWMWLDGSTLFEQACRDPSSSLSGSEVDTTVMTSGDVTASTCVQECMNQSYKYAGLQLISSTIATCTCGNTFTNIEGSQMKDCDEPCPADDSQWCGSVDRQLVLSVTGTDAKFWAASQPNYLNKYQGCLSMSSNNEYKMQDDYCYVQNHYFICEYDVPNCISPRVTAAGKCISVKQEIVNWFQAKESCESEEGSLLKLDNTQVWTEIIATSAVSDITDMHFWVGARSLVWRWIEGDIVDYSNWVEQQPDDFEETCMAMYRFSGGSDADGYKWQDELCSQSFHYVCKYSEPVTTTTTAPTTTTTPTAISSTTTMGDGTSATVPSATSTSDPNGTANPQGNTDDKDKDDDDDLETGIIIAIVIVAVIVVLVFLRLAYYCCQKSRTQKGDREELGA